MRSTSLWAERCSADPAGLSGENLYEPLPEQCSSVLAVNQRKYPGQTATRRTDAQSRSVQTGSLFSRKALMPSWASGAAAFDAITGVVIS